MLGRGKRSTAQQSDYERRRAYNLYPFVCVCLWSNFLQRSIVCCSHLLTRSCCSGELHTANFPTRTARRTISVAFVVPPIHFTMCFCFAVTARSRGWRDLCLNEKLRWWCGKSVLVCMCVWVCALFACLWRSISSVSFFIVTFCIILFNFLLFFFT